MGRKKKVKFNYTPLDFAPQLGYVYIGQHVYYNGEDHIAIQGCLIKAECVTVLPTDTHVRFDNQLKAWVVEE